MNDSAIVFEGAIPAYDFRACASRGFISPTSGGTDGIRAWKPLRPVVPIPSLLDAHLHVAAAVCGVYQQSIIFRLAIAERDPMRL